MRGRQKKRTGTHDHPPFDDVDLEHDAIDRGQQQLATAFGPNDEDVVAAGAQHF